MTTSRQHSENAKYILGTKSTWRITEDKTVYLSFSKAIYSAHEASGYHASYFRTKSAELIPLSAAIIKKIKPIIQQEWMAKTQFKLKFLDEQAFSSQLSKKNILYVFASDVAAPSSSIAGLTISIGAPAQNPFMIIKLAGAFVRGKVDELNNPNIYMLLHEIGHALLLKHPVDFNDPTDEGPYHALDCTQTVMTYPSANHCKPVLDETNRIMHEHPDLLQKPSRLDSKLVTKLEKRLHNKYPTSIGAVDIAAANIVAERIERARYDDTLAYLDVESPELHEELMSTTGSLLSTMRDAQLTTGSATLDSILQSKLYEFLVGSITSFATDCVKVGSRCYSLPPDSVGLTKTSLGFFSENPAFNSYANTSALTATIPMPSLGK
jgi:hypothetical protein